MEYLQIGNVKIKKTAALAPMAGVADYAFRKVAKEYGAAYVVSEMASCKGMVYSDRKTADLLNVTDYERPMAVQLFGCDPEFVAPAVKIAESFKPDIIDLNSGCPVPKVAGNGSGSALMKNPKLVEEIVSKVSRAISKPVTVKIRKGFDENHLNAVEIAKIAEGAGAAAIAVHGRTREQYYSGKADWNVIRDVKEAVKIPVIGNGDITDAFSAKAMIDQTGCDGVMIGRACQGNPWIFRDVVSYLETGIIPPKPTMEEVREMVERHARLQLEIKGEYTGVREMRKHLSWYTYGYPNSAKFRQLINSMETMDELMESLDQIFPV